MKTTAHAALIRVSIMAFVILILRLVIILAHAHQGSLDSIVKQVTQNTYT